MKHRGRKSMAELEVEALMEALARGSTPAPDDQPPTTDEPPTSRARARGQKAKPWEVPDDDSKGRTTMTIEPPSNLSADELALWSAITSSRPATHWQGPQDRDLLVALVRATLTYRRCQSDLQCRGPILRDKNTGFMRTNPAARASAIAAAAIRDLRSQLRIEL